MAFSISTSITIHEKPEIIWQHLMDFSSYPAWNPFITSVKGEIKEGNTIHVNIQNMKFKPQIKEISPNERFRWLGNLFIPGIFDGEHIFELEYDKVAKTSLFIHRENFKGLLVPFLKKYLKNQTVPGFQQMNNALKTLVEQQ